MSSRRYSIGRGWWVFAIIPVVAIAVGIALPLISVSTGMTELSLLIGVVAVACLLLDSLEPVGFTMQREIALYHYVVLSFSIAMVVLSCIAMNYLHPMVDNLFLGLLYAVFAVALGYGCVVALNKGADIFGFLIQGPKPTVDHHL